MRGFKAALDAQIAENRARRAASTMSPTERALNAKLLREVGGQGRWWARRCSGRCQGGGAGGRGTGGAGMHCGGFAETGRWVRLRSRQRELQLCSLALSARRLLTAAGAPLCRLRRASKRRGPLLP